MNINEYIEGATSKIFDRFERKKVSAELKDHILVQKDFLEEIGYEPEKAEAMAVEKMGSYEDIAQELGALHNDFYTPVWDIIATAIWLAFLFGAHYILKQYIFDDIALAPLSLAGICIVCAIYFAISYIMLKRNKLPVIICTLAGASGTAVFVYLCIENVNALVCGSLDKLKNLLFSHQLCVKDSSVSKALIIIVTAVFTVLAVITVLSALIYFIKYITNSNSKFDNIFKTIIQRAAFLFTAVCVITGSLFIFNYFNTKNYLKDEYCSYYNRVIEMAQEYKTFDEIYNAIGETGDEYNASVAENGDIKSISFEKNLVNITIERCKYSSNDKHDTASYYELTEESNVKNPDVNYDYILYFSINYERYYKNFDSVAVKQLFTDENELDEITRFDTEDHTGDEALEFYKHHIPKLLICWPAKDDNCRSYFEWAFLTGNKYVYESDFEITVYTQADTDIFNKQKQIVDILKNNRNANYDEIAELTGTEFITNPVSYEDYKKAVNSLGSYFDDVKEDLLAAYEKSNHFKVNDDLYFILDGVKPYSYVEFVSKTKFGYFKIFYLDENIIDTGTYGENELFKKVYFTGKGYYAKNGLVYSSYDSVPYFEKDGTRYTYFTKNEDPGDNSGYIKHYCLINRDGEVYENDICYIDSDGYLFFDQKHLLKAEDDGLTYSDADGNTYTRAFETSWDKDGNIISYKDYSE